MNITMHAHVETKLNGGWEHYNYTTVKQQGYMWSQLTDLFGDGSATLGIAGLPVDATAITRHDYKLDEEIFDCSNTGYVMAEKLPELQRLLTERYQQLLSDGVDVSGIKDQYDLDTIFGENMVAGGGLIEHIGYEDLRIVYWFES